MCCCRTTRSQKENRFCSVGPAALGSYITCHEIHYGASSEFVVSYQKHTVLPWAPYAGGREVALWQTGLTVHASVLLTHGVAGSV